MGYQFAGFFITSRISMSESLQKNAIWRDIAAPFQGTGIFTSHLVGKDMAPEIVLSLAQEIGITGEDTWIFLQYDCWGGMIDYVYGMGVAKGTSFGPIEDSAHDTVEATYVELMERLDISAENSLNFAPFERGFWGEV